MRKRRAKSAMRVAAQAADIGIASPQVIAHRLTRMMRAGAAPSSADMREFQRMYLEKMAASQEAWMASWSYALRLNQQWAQAIASVWCSPWSGRMGASRLPLAAMQSSMINATAKSLAPFQRRAVANAKRLRKTRH